MPDWAIIRRTCMMLPSYLEDGSRYHFVKEARNIKWSRRRDSYGLPTRILFRLSDLGGVAQQKNLAPWGYVNRRVILWASTRKAVDAASDRAMNGKIEGAGHFDEVVEKQFLAVLGLLAMLGALILVQDGLSSPTGCVVEATSCLGPERTDEASNVPDLATESIPGT